MATATNWCGTTSTSSPYRGPDPFQGHGRNQNRQVTVRTGRARGSAECSTSERARADAASDGFSRLGSRTGEVRRGHLVVATGPRAPTRCHRDRFRSPSPSLCSTTTGPPRCRSSAYRSVRSPPHEHDQPGTALDLPACTPDGSPFPGTASPRSTTVGTSTSIPPPGCRRQWRSAVRCDDCASGHAAGPKASSDRQSTPGPQGSNLRAVRSAGRRSVATAKGETFWSARRRLRVGLDARQNLRHPSLTDPHGSGEVGGDFHGETLAGSEVNACGPFKAIA